MKWLILILFISCGHESPPAQDVGDADGDTIPNYLETDGALGKYVAEITPFQEMKGELMFKVDHKPVTLALGNQSNIADEAKKLLTKSLSLMAKENYFSEWSDLEVEGSSDNIVIPDADYEVTLSMNTQDAPQTLVLSDGKSEIVLSDYHPRMEFRLTGEELRKILKGKIKLTLKKSDSSNPYSIDSNVRKRTYRVYYHNGRIGKIQYVSKELSFSDYLKLSGIQDPVELKTIQGFVSRGSSIYWWIRHLENGDKVVFRGSHAEIAEFHKKNFHFQESTIGRSNGSALPTSVIKKDVNSKLVIRFRGERSKRTFTESHSSRSVGGARGERNDTCTSYFREISQTDNFIVSKDDMIKEISLSVEGKKMNLLDLTDALTQGEDEQGKFLELALDRTPAEMSLYVSGSGSETYVKTGNYLYTCGDSRPRHGGADTNIEGHFSIKMETFIEKMD